MMAQLIPWSEFEAEYAQNFATSMGPPAKSFRMVLGELIVKEKLGASDRETVEQIRENPYMQYVSAQKTSCESTIVLGRIKEKISLIR